MRMTRARTAAGRINPLEVVARFAEGIARASQVEVIVDVGFLFEGLKVDDRDRILLACNVGHI